MPNQSEAVVRRCCNSTTANSFETKISGKSVVEQRSKRERGFEEKNKGLLVLIVNCQKTRWLHHSCTKHTLGPAYNE